MRSRKRRSICHTAGRVHFDLVVSQDGGPQVLFRSVLVDQQDSSMVIVQIHGTLLQSGRNSANCQSPERKTGGPAIKQAPGVPRSENPPANAPMAWRIVN